MKKKTTLSVTIITKNAAATIGKCLESVAFADEIVVLDSGSIDETLEICRRHTSNIHTSSDWPGFGVQKNRVLDMATGEWVLSIDADEWVSPQLQEEILAAIRLITATNAFAIPRFSNFCGRFMRHSGWYPDYVIRLFRKGCARFSTDIVHERLDVQGRTLKLKNHLLHTPFDCMEEALHKMDSYSTAGARKMFEQGKRASLSSALVHAFWSFFHTYFIKLGILDGRHGFMLAVANSQGTYYRYLKLMLMRRKEK